MAGRPRLPVSTFGSIKSIEVGLGRFGATSRFRDWDGQTSKVSSTASSRNAATTALKDDEHQLRQDQPDHERHPLREPALRGIPGCTAESDRPKDDRDEQQRLADEKRKPNDRRGADRQRGQEDRHDGAGARGADVDRREAAGEKRDVVTHSLSQERLGETKRRAVERRRVAVDAPRTRSMHASSARNDALTSSKKLGRGSDRVHHTYAIPWTLASPQSPPTSQIMKTDSSPRRR